MLIEKVVEDVKGIVLTNLRLMDEWHSRKTEPIDEDLIDDLMEVLRIQIQKLSDNLMAELKK